MASSLHLFDSAGIHVLFISWVRHAWWDSANKESCRWSRYQDKRVVSNPWLSERQILTSDDNITFLSPTLFLYILLSFFPVSDYFHFLSFQFSSHTTFYFILFHLFLLFITNIALPQGNFFATLPLKQSTRKRKTVKTSVQKRQFSRLVFHCLILPENDWLQQCNKKTNFLVLNYCSQVYGSCLQKSRKTTAFLTLKFEENQS